MEVNWYPGHMAKTKRELAQHLKLVNVVLEVADARMPASSRNPLLGRLIGDKPRLLLLNKSDMSDKGVTKSWVEYYSSLGIITFAVTATKSGGMQGVITEAKKIAGKQRGQKPVRIMVVGIPNVGKSQVINSLAGRKSARTGDKPGITRGRQWIRIGAGLELLDTPGILWPKIAGERVGFNLSVTGALPEKGINMAEAAIELIRFLKRRYPERLKQRYNLEDIEAQPWTIMEEIAAKRGLLLAGGKPNADQAVGLLVREFRTGVLGPISLETPPLGL